MTPISPSDNLRVRAGSAAAVPIGSGRSASGSTVDPADAAAGRVKFGTGIGARIVIGHGSSDSM
jgi:hypothetical protein